MFRADKTDEKETEFRFPSSFETTFECVLPKNSPLLEWINSIPNPEKILKQVENMMKEYNIPKENIVADRNTLKWLFLKAQEQQKINPVEDEK